MNINATASEVAGLPKREILFHTTAFFTVFLTEPNSSVVVLTVGPSIPTFAFLQS